MQTIIETDAFLAAAKATGMSEGERDMVVSIVAADPAAGAIMPGTGGCRKLRVRKPGKGKSGGYRVITYYAGENFPTFLLTVFGKNEKDNLTRAERNALAGLTATLLDGLRRTRT